MTTSDQELTLADVRILLKQWEQDEYTQDTAGALRALLESQKALNKAQWKEYKDDEGAYYECPVCDAYTTRRDLGQHNLGCELAEALLDPR